VAFTLLPKNGKGHICGPYSSSQKWERPHLWPLNVLRLDVMQHNRTHLIFILEQSWESHDSKGIFFFSVAARAQKLQAI